MTKVSPEVTTLGSINTSESRQLILFYVANELLQTCRHKNAPNFRASWKKLLHKAIELIKTFFRKLQDIRDLRRDTNIAPKIERMLNIWEERRVYDGTYVSEMKKVLLKQEYITPVTKTKISDPKKIVEEYSPEAGIEVLRKCSILEEDSKFKMKQLDQSKLDFSNLDAVRKLKDRAHGREFSQMFDESYNALVEYVKSLEAELELRKKLLGTLERAEVFYDNQYHDAAVVADAYLKYGNRVGAMKQRASDFLENMPDEDIPSDDVEDAPSPGNTPPHMRMENEDMGTLDTFDRRSSGLSRNKRLKRKCSIADGSRPRSTSKVTVDLSPANLGEEDMDLSDDGHVIETSTRGHSRRTPQNSHREVGNEDFGVHDEDRYSPSGALPSVETEIERPADSAAAVAAMKIVSGYRPPLSVQNSTVQAPKMQATRDPRIHGLQVGKLGLALGIPPPPPPPPLAPHLHPRAPLLYPSLINAAISMQAQPPPPPPRPGTPVRDEAPDSRDSPDEAVGGSTPTQDEPPETSVQATPSTPNTAINFLSNFIQLNTNPPPPPPVPESETWSRPFHLPPPPPPPTTAVRMAAAAAQAAAQMAEFAPGFSVKPALRQVPMSEADEDGEEDKPTGSKDGDTSDIVTDGGETSNARPSPGEDKLPGLGSFSEEVPSGSKDVETGENEGHDVMMTHDEDERDFYNQDSSMPSQHVAQFRAMSEEHQLHRIQTIGGDVPHLRQIPQTHGMQHQFHHGSSGGRFMGGGMGQRPPRFGSGGRGNFAPRNFWQHGGGGSRSFRGQYRANGPRF